MSRHRSSLLASLAALLVTASLGFSVSCARKDVAREDAALSRRPGPSESRAAARSRESKRATKDEAVGASTGASEEAMSIEVDDSTSNFPAVNSLNSEVAVFDTEAYAHLAESGFKRAADEPLSTFSIDVDTASYSNVRRFLESGQAPPPGAVRIEELLNYFRYDDPAPRAGEPFSVSTEVASAPWAAERRLVRIGLRGRSIDDEDVPPRNLVFLLDVSGSMMSDDKLPLVKEGLSLLADRLRPEDHVGIVVYAGAAGIVLEPTSDRRDVLAALEQLQAGGSTNGAGGIRVAYDLAARNFQTDAVNRVILATDGDFNVGTTSQDELVRLIEKEREKGVFLTVLGFGTGNLKDSTMELLADKGNGNYAYVDSIVEARKVLVREAGATLVTIAKDVKIQVEWNPATVEAWRLIGYENRALAAEDFNDDRKDAGEIGAGHAVTALYEVVPKGGRVPASGIDPLRYQQASLTEAASEGDLMTLKLRWKEPDGDRSELLEVAVRDSGLELAQASDDLRFAASVASFGMLLRGSEHANGTEWADVIGMAEGALGEDKHGDRVAFTRLARMAAQLVPRQVAVTQ